jgi:NADPH:quinone reductase-like Zn-dependent oxidoreductase
VKAIIVHDFGPPSVMKFEETPSPKATAGDVVIEVHAVSVNRTLDCAARAGKYSRPISLPFTPGVDPSGVIVEVGSGVTHRKVGDRVAVRLNIGGEIEAGDSSQIGGGYAEYVCAPVGRTTIIPDNLDFVAATVISRHTPLAFALLRDQGRLQKNEWVLVMGAAGGLGSAGIQVARYLGAKVIAAAGADERVEVGLQIGADAGVNYRTQDLTAEVMKITNGKGANVVFENIGDPILFAKAFAAMASGGRLVTAGSHGGGAVPLDLTRLYQKRLTISGTTKATPDDIALSLKAAAEGCFRPVIDRILPLSAAVEAHEIVEARDGLGKVVLDPTRQ